MSAIDDLRKATDSYGAALQAVRDAETLLARVECRHGQDDACVSVGGVRFDYTRLDRDTGWRPVIAKGCEALAKAAADIARADLARKRGIAEGAQWKLKQIAKELT